MTEEANTEEVIQYQSLIGTFQWAVSLGRYDIFCATLSMGRSHSAPKKGHLQRLNRICGYLKKYPDGAIHFHTEIPNYSHLDHQPFDWTYSVYSGTKEE
jgi:hypothetical protein